MIQAVAAFPSMSVPLPAVEAFPTSLSVVYLAKLDTYLDAKTIDRLRDIEEQLRSHVDFGSILRARTSQGLQKALFNAYKVVADYYVESGICIWRALGHDYGKLLQLAQVSCQSIENLLFEHGQRLDRDTLVKAVAGLRVLAKVGEWVVLVEQAEEPGEQQPPMDYLAHVVLATFLTSCLMSYVTGDIKRARRANSRDIAEMVLSIADQAYQGAIQANLPKGIEAEQRFYWSPAWQQGEIEADLDKQSGAVKSFASVKDLLEDLHNA